MQCGNVGTRFDRLLFVLKTAIKIMLIAAGISPMVVQERLGHKNIQTTLDIYTTVTDSMHDIAGNVIDQIYSK